MAGICVLKDPLVPSTPEVNIATFKLVDLPGDLFEGNTSLRPCPDLAWVCLERMRDRFFGILLTPSGLPCSDHRTRFVLVMPLAPVALLFLVPL